MITRYGVDPICFPLPWKFPNTQGAHLEKPSPAQPNRKTQTKSTPLHSPWPARTTPNVY